jgi:hypothetical protein
VKEVIVGDKGGKKDKDKARLQQAQKKEQKQHDKAMSRTTAGPATSART